MEGKNNSVSGDRNVVKGKNNVIEEIKEEDLEVLKDLYNMLDIAFDEFDQEYGWDSWSLLISF